MKREGEQTSSGSNFRYPFLSEYQSIQTLPLYRWEPRPSESPNENIEEFAGELTLRIEFAMVGQKKERANSSPPVHLPLLGLISSYPIIYFPFFRMKFFIIFSRTWIGTVSVRCD